MKKRYGETKEYKKNRAHKIARNKARRNAFKSRYNSGQQNNRIKANSEVKPPREIRLLSNGIAFYRDSFSFKAPKIISFKSNPDETIEFISLIASVFMNKSSIVDLKLDFDETEYIDIGPLSIIDVIIDKGLNYFNKSGRAFHVHGFNPVNQEANIIFSYSGLPKTLGNFDSPNIDIVTLDPLINSDDANTETHKIINYYDDCLKKCGYELNLKGKLFFFNLINEIVDNAIIHCGSKHRPTYITSGFYNRFTSKGQLSIVSIGKSIYDTLHSEETLDDIKEQIEEIVKAHKDLGYPGFSEESIWTICALQSGVSCKKNSDDMDRGTGTVKFIEAFITLGQSEDKEKPIMTLLSGNSHITFDGKYKMEEKTKDNKTIAFNENNDLRQKPDEKYVKIIKNRFPGVVINIEFYIDRKYLDKFKKEE